MRDGEIPAINRRDMVKYSMLGGTSLLLGTHEASGEHISSPERGPFDIRKFGAVGDGKTDDTKAIQRALDAAGEIQGAVFVPPGIYLVADLRMRPCTALVGTPTWAYEKPGGTVLRLATPNAACAIYIGGAYGVTIDGLVFEGAGLGKGVHGIFLDKPDSGNQEDTFRIERCQVRGFTGDGLHLSHAWCFSVRHSMFAFNGGDGLCLRGWDGFISDNWFSGNKRAGFAAREENASITFTGNRIEGNGEENVLITKGNSYQFTGNFFDGAGKCGIALLARCAQMTMTGNYFRHSGRLADVNSYDSAHIRIEEAAGIVCTGNDLHGGRDAGNVGIWSPAYGIVYKDLENCVIANNVLHLGAMRQLLIDQGSKQNEGVIIQNNPGSLFKTSL
jgi:hypothetical protein